MMRLLSIVWIMCLFSACSTSRLHSVSGFDQLAIVTGQEKHGVASADSTRDRTGKGALVGGSAGAGAGVILSLFCGPWAPFCMLYAVPTLGGAGAVGGSLYGITGLPEGVARQVSEKLRLLKKTHDLNETLQSSIVAALPVNRLVPQDQAKNLMLVEIDKIELNQESGDKFALIVHSKIILRTVGSDKDDPIMKKRYSSTGQHMTVDDWLDNSGHAFETELGLCITDIAEQISSDILTAGR